MKKCFRAMSAFASRASRTNVEEYCISEGWVRVTAGAAKDRYGNPLTIKVHGPVEPYFRDKNAS